MKKAALFFSALTLLFSCRKAEIYNPDEHIQYHHWYKLGVCPDSVFSIYIPDAFTPNNDGINDSFYPRGSFSMDHIYVFNRTGEVIFETGDANKHWDGRDHNGPILPPGSYTYRLIVEDPCGEKYEYSDGVLIYK